MATEDKEREFLKQIDENLISVTDAAAIGHLTPSYIRRLLRTGQLFGKKLDSDWFTTEKAIRDFLTPSTDTGPPRPSRIRKHVLAALVAILTN